MEARQILVFAIVAVIVAAAAYFAGYSAAPTKTVTSTVESVATLTVTKTQMLTETYSEIRTVTVTTTHTVVKRVGFMPKQINVQEEVKKIMNKLSPQSRACVNCHMRYTPGIVADWLMSKHARVTPAEAWKKPELQREISALPPENMRDYIVGCYECHGLNPDKHPDTFEHFGFKIHTIVTPPDCAVCHPVEVEEYGRSVKAHAHNNLVKNPVYMLLVNASTQINMFGIKAGYHLAVESACFACHGAKVEFVGLKEIQVGNLKLKVPVYKGWPNHGVGRVNPDGSEGSCTACHPRHAFSIEVARSPYTCSQCHLDPDVPAFDVWKESKHGNIFLAQWKTYNMTAVPWVPGRDFRAPSCAVCHFSLLVDKNGNVIAPRTHDVGSRIWIRLFGVYAHPQPKIGETWKIKNKDGLPLPYSLLDAEPAWDYVISKEEMAKRREQMIKICSACHSENYARERIAWFEGVVNETNKAILASTQLLVEAWKKGVAKGLLTGDNPFDEYIERLWIETWLFYANSIRYGAAMNGPDWTTFKRGWYQLTRTLGEMQMLIELHGK
ncbi:hypothetical protein Pyrfu_1339 [Pyrolobus fumarii 1A]|uniref:Uncharacterized protein n=1 Tax=Pyrolobus fumarii (strain DSM 11204 / 1A) TaxID=694429 RepID=G0EGP9_PYRF1|nr:multiheme c-type cytochrome [Pyrolobus fumarii]AEM39197.1 hypothetical protein Pyrfu_1339 [Pyrolobus fumarii 1A]